MLGVGRGNSSTLLNEKLGKGIAEAKLIKKSGNCL